MNLESWMVRRVTTESLWTALPVEQECKYSQFQHLTECARRHISPTTSKTHDFKTTPATTGLALCPDATLGIKAHRWVLVNTHGTPMPAREGRGEPNSTTTRQQDSDTYMTPQHVCQTLTLPPGPISSFFFLSRFCVLLLVLFSSSQVFPV